MKTSTHSGSDAKTGHIRQLAVKAVLSGKKQVEVAKIFG
jgi:hypothetical protein